jgi:hypothetical protein
MRSKKELRGWRIRLPPVAVCDPDGSGILRLSRTGLRETQTLNRVSAPAREWMRQPGAQIAFESSLAQLYWL